MPGLKHTPDMEKKAFSIEEFSNRWGWGRNTTYSLIAASKLKSVKIGARRVITADQEKEFADNLSKNPIIKI
jgi:hypothetical protein